MSKMKIIVIVSLSVLILAGVVGGIYWYRLVSTGDPLRHILLAENIHLSHEWTVIEAEKITFSGDERFLALSIEKPFFVDFDKKGIIAADGQVFNPDLLLIDAGGNEFPLFYRGSIGRMRPYYKLVDEQNGNRQFVELRIRSSQQLNLTKITWTYYYAWEMP